MTILIKGMEIPENCDDCFLGDFYCEKCQHIDGYKMAGSRPFDCPLIEVPTPHGRLGDLDRLYKHIKAECNIYGKPTIGEEDGNKVLKIIEDTRTVIEAEESEG